MSNYIEEINKMTEATLKVVKDMIKKCAKCDQTYTCKVTEVIAADKVKIKHNSSEYTASTSVYCEVGDMVRVTAPCGNLEDMFVVENKSRGKTIRDLKASVGTLADDHSALKTDFNGKLQTIGGSYYPITLLPCLRYSDLGINPEEKIYFETYLKWMVNNAAYKTCDIGIGVGIPNSAGIMFLHIYEISNWNNTGLPRYCDGFFYNLTRTCLSYFGTYEGSYYYYTS